MKTILLAIVVVATAASSFGQIYGARRYTQRISPQLRPAPQPARPNPTPPAQQPQQQQAAAAPQNNPPPVAPPVYAPQYQPVVTARPADPVKAAATKAKNEEKQFEYFKRRAEEGSDHAQYELGLRYLSGKGVPADEKLGREWLSKAAKNGNSQAAKKLAELGEGEKSETPAAAEPAVKAEPKTSEPK